MENHDGMISTGETYSSTKAPWRFYQQNLVEKEENMAKGIMNFAYETSLSCS
jgi:hypothetical protein